MMEIIIFNKHFPSEEDSGIIGEYWLSLTSCFIGVLVFILVDPACLENVPF